MTDRELPSWAVRLRQERVRRLWSQKITAVPIRPVMNLAPEYRVATITAYTTQIEKRLQRRRFLRDSTAVAIRSRVHEFNAKALTRSGRGSA